MTPEDEVLKAFPDWTEEEREIWVEQFSEIRGGLMEARMEAAGDKWWTMGDDDRVSSLSLDVQSAARLADECMNEIHLRFDIQNLKTSRQAMACRKKEREEFRGRRQQQEIAADARKRMG